MEKSLQTVEKPRDKEDLSALLDTKKPQERTFGLKAFDAFLYPFLTNTGVFLISAAATYLTNKGGQRGADGKLIYGKVGTFLQWRGDAVLKWFKNRGLSHDQADAAKMVVWSFLDGSTLAPVVKKFEDNRENIAQSIDELAGTKPDNPSVYEAEPKQSWLSVLGGRLATVSLVVPTAIAFGKFGLNEAVLNKPGRAIGRYVQSNTNLAKKFKNIDFPELGRVGVFEFVYTSICTTGLYFISRFFARQGDRQKDEKTVPVEPAPHHNSQPQAPATDPLSAPELVKKGKPDTAITEAVAAERLQSNDTAVSMQS